MKKILIALSILSILSSVSAQAAFTLSADEEVRREEIAGICLLVGQGVYDAAVARQSGISQDEATQNLNAELKNLEGSFEGDLPAFIGSAWNNGLKIIYNLPIQDSPEAKEAFVSQALDASLQACFNDLDGE